MFLKAFIFIKKIPMKNTFLVAIFLLVHITFAQSQKETTDFDFFLEQFPSIKEMRFDELREDDFSKNYILKNKTGLFAEYSRVYLYGRSTIRLDDFTLKTETKSYHLSMGETGSATFEVKQYSKKTGKWKKLYKVERERTGYPYKIRLFMLVERGGLCLYH